MPDAADPDAPPAPRSLHTDTAEDTDAADPIAILDDPRVEALGMLLETHNEVVNELQRRLEGHEHRPVSWIGVLIRLARSPGQRLRMTELAKDMTMSTSGLTRLVDRIEEAGHVRREACPDDRRGLHAVLTPAGRDLLAGMAPAHVSDIDALLAAPLTPAELATLTELLRRVRDHVRNRVPGT